MEFHVVSLFPQMIQQALEHGVCGRAIDRGIVRLATVDPRDYAADAHGTVDDRPYGGGPGMVLKVEPLRTAIRAARAAAPAGAPVVFLTPTGRRFDQPAARRFAGLPGLVIVAGRYEGFDERLLALEADEEISLGDFVISGGEIAALAIVDAVTRLLPGALGDEQSAAEDSFSDGLLDHPHYTRPERIEGLAVPQVLIEGHHARIRRWRRKAALGRTWLRRPELLQSRPLSEEDQALLSEFIEERRSAGGDAAFLVTRQCDRTA